MPWFLSRRARSARSASRVVSSPASPNAPRFLLGKNEKQPIAPSDADRTRLVRGADRLRRVLDHRDAGARRLVENRIHVGAQAEQMHRHDRLRPRRDRSRERRRIDVERRRIDVDQHRPRADADNAARRREERIGGRDHLVAGTDARAPSAPAGRHRCPTTRRRRAARRAAATSSLSSASISGPHDEPLAVAHARDRGEDLVAQRAVLRLQIEQRNVHCGYCQRHPSGGS